MEFTGEVKTCDRCPALTGMVIASEARVARSADDDNARVIPRIPRPRKPQDPPLHPPRRPSVPPQTPPADR